MSEESEDTKRAVCQYRSVRGLWFFVLVAVGLLVMSILSDGLLAIAYFLALVSWATVVILKGELISTLIMGLITAYCTFSLLSTIIAENRLSEAIPVFIIAIPLAFSIVYLQKRLCRGSNKSVGGR